MTSRSHFIISIQVYSTLLIQYSTLQGKTKKEGTDSLTLVNVFILYTHCHKYRIYFFIIEGGPGGASPRHHLLQICNTHLLWCITLLLAPVFSLFTHCHKYRIYFYPEVPTTKSQGWVPTKPQSTLLFNSNESPLQNPKPI